MAQLPKNMNYFIFLLFVYGFFTIYATFGVFNPIYLWITVGLGVGVSAIMIYLIRASGYEFSLEHLPEFDYTKEKELKLSKVNLFIIGIFGLRIGLTYIFVVIHFEPIFVFLILLVLDIFDTQLIRGLARNRTMVLFDDITGYVIEVILMVFYLMVWYVATIIIADLVILIVSHIDLSKGWLRAFTPDVLFIYPFLYNPYLLYWVLNGVFVYALLQYDFNVEYYLRVNR